MKNIMALTLIIFSTSLFAINMNEGNNMGQESAPRVEGTRQYRYNYYMGNNDPAATTYNTEMNNRSYNDRSNIDDSISTGQSSTMRNRNKNRNNVESPASVRPVERCIDRSGYSYNKNDSGFGACVNQRSNRMK